MNVTAALAGAVEDATKPAHEHDYGRIWVDKPKVVFSTTLTETRWNTRVVPSGARDEVLRLKNESKGCLPACRSFGVAWT